MLLLAVILSTIITKSYSTPDRCSANVTLKLQSPELVTNDVPYTKNIVVETRLSMQFIIQEKVDVKKIKFRLNDGPIDVDNDGRPPVHYLIEQKSSLTNITLVIEIPKQHYIGEWSMTLEKDDDSIITQKCFLLAPVLLYRFEETLRASEGKELTAVCRAVGLTPPKKMQWYKTVKKDDGTFELIKFDSGDKMKSVEGDTLHFADARKTDSGVYICNATDGASTDSTVAVVQIKSRLAALWPFIGILAELIVLLVTIIVYERHKAVKAKKSAVADSLLSTKVDAAGDTHISTSSHVKV